MFAHTQVIQEVDEFFFIGADLEKCSITSLADQLIHCSEWVPSEWESGGRGDSLEEALLWIIDWDFGQKQLLYFYQLFGCVFWWHPFTSIDEQIMKC